MQREIIDEGIALKIEKMVQWIIEHRNMSNTYFTLP